MLSIYYSEETGLAREEALFFSRREFNRNFDIRKFISKTMTVVKKRGFSP